MWGNALLLALRAIQRNAMRSFLTMLGIIIGVAAVIILVTLGKGATQQVTDQIAGLGSNMLIIHPGKQMMGPSKSSEVPPFKLADAEAIEREISSVKLVAPGASKPIAAIAGNENWSTTVIGSTEDYFEINNRKMGRGRGFTPNEARVGVAVCVIGETVRTKLFGSRNPIGHRLRLGNVSCEIIGLLVAKGQSTMGTDQDDIAIIPLRTYHRRISGNDHVTIIQASVRDGASMERTQEDIVRLLRDRRRLSRHEEDNFDVMDLEEIATMVSGTTRVLTALLGVVAAISLLVGGIGIMNIMLVSVTERTREIGIRLAIGALEREVLLQFLVEAVVVSCCGGLIGTALALVSSVALAKVMAVPFVLHIPVILGSVFFSAAIGMVFGYFPARKAARLDPIDALRYE